MNHTKENSMQKEVKVLVDGRELPLVPFVAALFVNTLCAMVASLKGGENAKRITIEISEK